MADLIAHVYAAIGHLHYKSPKKNAEFRDDDVTKPEVKCAINEPSNRSNDGYRMLLKYL